LGISADKTAINKGNGVSGVTFPAVYDSFINEFGQTAYAVPISLGWARDTRDSALVPSTGRVLRVNGEWSVGGDLRYARASTQYQQFYPISKKTTAALNFELAAGASTNSNSYPVFKNYYSGGLGSVRGFEQGSLTTAAQRAAAVGSAAALATGGAKKVTLNAEILSPLPGGGNDRTLRWYGFWDIGGIYGADEGINMGDMRSSVGVGISWISPVGPLRLAFARPVRQFENDKIQYMQFQIGTSF
jgi:outer membrane protein insertion porin family